MYDLGQYIERGIPDKSTKADGQLASVTLNKELTSKEFTTNAASYSEMTNDSLENAYKILEYYSNNLEELGDLGSKEIKEAAKNDQKEVTFDVLTAADFAPSEEMSEAMENEENVSLTISSDDIEDGALYFVIHESDVREGYYDVLLTQASGTDINIEIPDLSPVSYTKVSINTVKTMEIEDPEDAETPEAVDETENDGISARTIILYILLILIIVGFVVFNILLKKNKLPFLKK